MAWVESAVVFYLRSMIHRLVPHQPEPLPLAGGFAFAELVREAATLIMLVCVGALAGRTWRQRIGYALLAFGVWDIAYYLWLIPLTGWPRNLFDWDILFLIPLPWWGPVWAPVSIAFLMLVFGLIVGSRDRPGRPCWPRWPAWTAAGLGAVLALGTFMVDAWQVVRAGGGAEGLRHLLPQRFETGWFLLALGLMACPVIAVIRAGREGAGVDLTAPDRLDD